MLEEMLTENQLKVKLHNSSEEFKELMLRKRYAAALICHDKALATARYMELDQNFLDELFGVRGEKGTYIIEGKFPEPLVLEAEKMVIVMGLENGLRRESKSK